MCALDAASACTGCVCVLPLRPTRSDGWKLGSTRWESKGLEQDVVSDDEDDNGKMFQRVFLKRD